VKYLRPSFVDFLRDRNEIKMLIRVDFKQLLATSAANSLVRPARQGSPAAAMTMTADTPLVVL
jgi:hypothetical protein